MRLDALEALADDHGLLVRGELVPSRLSRKAWRYAHACGLLVVIHPGVSRLVTSPETPALLVAAAIAGARPVTGGGRAFAAGRTAASLSGIDVPATGPIHVVLKGRPHLTRLEGVRVHRPRDHLDLVAHDPADAIPRTRLVRALLDTAAWDPHLTSSVLEQMIVKRMITIEDAAAAVRRHSKQGRPGLTVLRQAVEAWGLRQRPPDSVLEARFAALRQQHDLPAFEFQRPIGRYRVDFCRDPEMVIVECVGFADHGRRQEQIERDNERKAELTAEGWLVMEFTWHQINHRSAWVASRIRRTLMQRRAAPP